MVYFLFPFLCVYIRRTEGNQIKLGINSIAAVTNIVAGIGMISKVTAQPSASVIIEQKKPIILMKKAIRLAQWQQKFKYNIRFLLSASLVSLISVIRSVIENFFKRFRINFLLLLGYPHSIATPCLINIKPKQRTKLQKRKNKPNNSISHHSVCTPSFQSFEINRISSANTLKITL